MGSDLIDRGGSGSRNAGEEGPAGKASDLELKDGRVQRSGHKTLLIITLDDGLKRFTLP